MSKTRAKRHRSVSNLVKSDQNTNDVSICQIYDVPYPKNIDASKVISQHSFNSKPNRSSAFDARPVSMEKSWK